jgi:hypothetical protein
MHRTRTSRRGTVAPAEADSRIDLSSSLEQRLAALFSTPQPKRADSSVTDEPREDPTRRRRG